MRKVEILEEEIIIVKMALDLYKNTEIDKSEAEIISKIMIKLKEALNKSID